MTPCIDWSEAPSAAACDAGHLCFQGDLCVVLCKMLYKAGCQAAAISVARQIHLSTRRLQTAIVTAIVRRYRRFKIVSPYAWQPSRLGTTSPAICKFGYPLKLRRISPGTRPFEDPWRFEESEWEACGGTIANAEFEGLPDPPEPIVVVLMGLGTPYRVNGGSIVISPVTAIEEYIGHEHEEILEIVNLALGTDFASVGRMWMLASARPGAPEYVADVDVEDDN